MRPVNLIPMEERRGERAPSRTGPLVYILIGGLCLILGGVALLIQSGNKISESKADVTRLNTELAAANSAAAKLTPYTKFNALASSRTTTITQLADSRFDWQRVVRELSAVLPDDIQLESLTGTVRPDVTTGDTESIPTRASVPGPALELVGCASNQDKVADLVTQLRDIDGVTRVGVQSSSLPDDASSGGSQDGCQTNPTIVEFQIVVAFDAAPVPASATGSDDGADATPTEAATSTAATASTDSSTSTDSSAGDTSTGG